MAQSFNQKKELRTKIRDLRKSLDMEEKSSTLVRKLMLSEEYKQAQNIMIFYPTPNEVNLLALLDDKSKRFFLPKIDGQNLLCIKYLKGDKLCQSRYKTMEPLSGETDKNLMDLIIVPALACDLKNYRLGQGGGFYDRFLADIKCTTITCIPKELIVETVFPEEFDVKIDKIITD